MPQGAAATGPQIASMFDLRDKVAVVADSGGCGSREIALVLAEAGARVTVLDHAFAKAEAVAAEIVAAGGRANAVQADIENEGEVVAAFAGVAAAAGGLDILVNCAGMTAPLSLADTPADIWDAMISVNLRANFLCMREAVRHMLAAGRGGRIVSITAIAATQPVASWNAAYGAPRAGVTALSRDAALDYAQDGILINTIQAGNTPNKVLTHPSPLVAARAAERPKAPISGPNRLPLGTCAMADIAAAALYLVSPAGRYLTGQSIVLDGGFFLT